MGKGQSAPSSRQVSLLRGGEEFLKACLQCPLASFLVSQAKQYHLHDGEVIRAMVGMVNEAKFDRSSATRALVYIGNLVPQIAIVGSIPWLVEVISVVELFAIQIGQYQDPPTVPRFAIGSQMIGRWESAMVPFGNFELQMPVVTYNGDNCCDKSDGRRPLSLGQEAQVVQGKLRQVKATK